MNSRISERSEVTCAEIAVLMMAIANYICEETITTTFDTKLYMNQMSTKNGIIANASSIEVNGGGTDISLPIRYLLDNNIFVDRIIILSDYEINRGYGYLCQSYVEKYRKKVNPDVWVHAIDMMGYGTQQFMGHKVNLIAGWSEKALDFISKAEQGIDTLRPVMANIHSMYNMKAVDEEIGISRCIDRDKYEIKLSYYTFEEEEVIRKILALGPYVKVLYPKRIVDEVVFRIKRAVIT